MKCPKCNDKSEVLQTLQIKGSTDRRRRCMSPRCGYRFTTKESDLGHIEKRQISPDKLLAKLKDKKRKPGSSFDPEAVEAALRVDARRAQIKREAKYRRIEWDDDAFEPAPTRLDHDSMRREIDGY